MGLYKRSDRGGKRGPWYASYVDHSGKQVRFNTHTTDKQTAQALLGKRKSDDARRREGITDASTERLAKAERSPISVHLDAYLQSLISAGRSQGHIDRQRDRITIIVDGAGFSRLSDISPPEIQKVVNNIRTGKSQKLVAAGTRRHYLTAIKSFTAWLASEGGKLPNDPLRAMKKPDAKKDRKLIRRALLVTEWQAMRELVPNAGLSWGMEATERLMVYELAIQTGLRAGELHSLTRSRIKFSGSKATAVVPSGITKDSEDAYQSISGDLVARLKRHVSKKLPGANVFGLPRLDAMAEMLRRDIDFARNTWDALAETDPARKQTLEENPDFLRSIDSSDERIDFHALRHSCGAWLALANVHVKTIQSVMRHKDVKLTLDTYGHLFRSMETEAVERMSAMISGTSPEAAATITGNAVTTASVAQ